MGDSGVLVLAKLHPFEGETKKAWSPHGQSVAEIIRRPDAPVVVIADGELIERADWDTVVPTHHCCIQVCPEGDAGRILGSIAIIALASWAAASIAAAYSLGAGASAALTAGLNIAGQLAFNALVPPPTPSSGGGSPQQLAQITGQSNEVRPYQPIPKAYGTVKWYPPIPMTALPFTEIVGDDQFIRMKLCLGYGPLEIGGIKCGGTTAFTDNFVITNASTLTGNPIRIGDTPIDQFDDVQFQIGRPDQVRLYTREVVEQAVNVSMPLSDEPEGAQQDVVVMDNQAVVRTTDPDTVEATLDVFFPLFFVMGSGGKVRTASVRFRVEYRESGSSDSWTVADSNWLIISSERKPYRQGRRIVFPTAGQWDVRLTRERTFLGRTATIVADATWTVLRSIKDATVRAFDVPGTVVMDLRIRATDQLGGRIDRLSVETSSVLKVWNGSDWVAETTGRPPWVYADTLTGNATREPLPLDRINGPDLKDWADWCVANGIEYSGVVDQEGTVLQRAREAASVGFGGWAIDDDATITVARDIDGDDEGMVTPRTSSDFSVERAYHRLPHALRVQYTDPDTLEQDEILVFDDGFNESNAERFEQLPTVGIRDPELAWKHGRFHLAQFRRRPEIYSWQDDIRHLSGIRRGKQVAIQQAVMLVGLQSGRIKSVTLNGGGDATHAVVDELLVMEPSTDYGVRIQKSDGTIVTQAIVNATPGTNEIEFTAPVAGIGADNSFAFGLVGEEAISAKVTRIEPTGSMRARLTAVPAAPDIFDAWSGTIPDFDPVITEPVDESLLPPPIPVLETLSSGLLAMPGDSHGNIAVGILASYTMPPGLTGVSIDVSIRTWQDIPGEGELLSQWRVSNTVLTDDGSVKILNVEEGIHYDVRLRSRRGNRVSSWSNILRVQAAFAPAVAPSNLVALPNPEGIRVRWTLPPDPAGYDIVRLYMSATNDFGTAEIEYEGRANETIIPLPALALRYFWIASVRRDEEGLRSPATTTTDVAAIAQLATASEIVVKSEQAPLATEGRIWVRSTDGDFFLATGEAAALTDEAEDILTEEGGKALVDGEWEKIGALDVLRLINAPEEAGANVTETRTSNNTDNVAGENALTVEEAAQRAIAALEATGLLKPSTIAAINALLLENGPAEAGANVTETRTSNNTANVATEPALTVEEAVQRAIAALEASGNVKAGKVVSSSILEGAVGADALAAAIAYIGKLEIASSGAVWSGKETFGSAANGWFLGRDGGEPAIVVGTPEGFFRFKPSEGVITRTPVRFDLPPQIGASATALIGVTGSDAQARMRFDDDGTVRKVENPPSTSFVDTGLRWGEGVAGADYEQRFEPTSGSVSDGTVNAWIAFGGSSAHWSVTQSGEGEKSVTGTYKIRRKSDNLVVTEATLTLFASVIA